MYIRWFFRRQTGVPVKFSSSCSLTTNSCLIFLQAWILPVLWRSARSCASEPRQPLQMIISSSTWNTYTAYSRFIWQGMTTHCTIIMTILNHITRALIFIRAWFLLQMKRFCAVQTIRPASFSAPEKYYVCLRICTYPIRNSVHCSSLLLRLLRKIMPL